MDRPITWRGALLVSLIVSFVVAAVVVKYYHPGPLRVVIVSDTPGVAAPQVSVPQVTAPAIAPGTTTPGGAAGTPVQPGLVVRVTIHFEGGTGGNQIDKATGQMVFNDSSIEVSVPAKKYKETGGRIFMDKDGHVGFQMPDFPLAALPVTADITFKRNGYKTVVIRNVTVTSTEVKLPEFTMPKQ